MSTEWGGGKRDCPHRTVEMCKRRVMSFIIVWDKCTECGARTGINVRKRK